jgi:hypothetical protein
VRCEHSKYHVSGYKTVATPCRNSCQVWLRIFVVANSTLSSLGLLGRPDQCVVPSRRAAEILRARSNPIKRDGRLGPPREHPDLDRPRVGFHVLGDRPRRASRILEDASERRCNLKCKRIRSIYLRCLCLAFIGARSPGTGLSKVATKRHVHFVAQPREHTVIMILCRCNFLCQISIGCRVIGAQGL